MFKGILQLSFLGAGLLFVCAQPGGLFGQGISAPGLPLNEPRKLAVAPAGTTAKAKTAFNALPRGAQIFHGVPFQIEGPVNIIGARAGRAGGKEFARVRGSMIHGRGKHIHVLHTGDHGSSPQGDFIWRLVLHYSDGESRRFDFAYGVHIRNYWRHANETDSTVTDTNSAVAWVGTSLESDRKGAELRVFRSTLRNPRPEVEIVAADYVSLLGQSSAYVLAVTISDGGPDPVRPEEKVAPGISLLTLFLQDEAGIPQTQATLNCVLEAENYAVRFYNAPADALGRVIVDVPREVVSMLRYQVMSSEVEVQSGAIEITPSFRPASQHTVRFASP